MLTHLIFGAITGLALGLTGAGGGILAIPLLTVGAGLAHTDAAPIALLAVAVASGLGAFMGLRAGMVRYRAALLVGGIGMLVAPLGLWLAHRLPTAVLTSGLALVMTWSAISMALRSRSSIQEGRVSVAPPCCRSPSTGRFIWTRLCACVLAGVGLVTGALSGLLGVGGGFILVPALSRLSNLRPDSIVCTSQTVIALVAATGAFTAAAQDNLQWRVAVPFITAAICALLVGRALNTRLAPTVIQRCFAGLSGGIALTLFCQLALDRIAD